MTGDRLTIDAVIATSTVALLAYGAALAMRRRGGALRHSVARLALLAFWLAPVGALAVDAFHGGFCPVPVSASRIAVSQGTARPVASDLSARSAWAGRNRPARTRLRAEPTRGSVRRRPSPLALLIGVWAAGVVVSLVWFGAHLRTVRRVRRAAAAVDDAGLADRIGRLCQRVGLAAPPAVARSGALAVPAIAGCRRPVLLLPEAFSADDPSCDAVLVHELAHIRRRDLWAQWLARLTRAVWWWHPLAWLIAGEVQASAEEACDDWAVAFTGHRRRYADHLVRWAEAARAGGALAYTCGGRALVARVRRVLAQTRVPDLMPSRRARALAMVCTLAATGAAATLRAQPPAPRSEHSMGEAAMIADGREVSRYGFRRDPMAFVANDHSIQGALVRSQVFARPAEGDASLIQARIDEILAAQTEEGALSDHPLHAVTQTGGKIREAVELGAAPDDPRIRRAVAYVAKHEGVDEKGEALGIGMARTLRLVGAADGPAVRDAVRRQIAQAEDWIHPWSGCPWTPAGALKELWELRDVGEGVDDVITRGLQGIAPKLNEAGCLDFNDPWGYLDVAGTVDHPLGRQIAEKQIPMILRSQEKDGGWGEHSLIVFRALVKYDLLAPLRQRPPLPPDWEVVRSVPAPDGDLSSLAWDGARLWVCDRQANEAIAVSPDDGKVVRRLKIPGEHVRAVGWWDGALAVTQQLPTERGWTSEEETRRLLRVNPETGQVERNIALQHMNNIWGVVQVDGRLIVADGFINAVGIFDAAAPGEPRIRTLGAPGTIQLAAQDGTLWHSDWLLTEIIFRSDLEGRLLDWGTKPFDGDLEGLAWDGEHLWALDSAARRIHVIERTAVPGPA